jgi:hypothetical protein
MNDEPPIVGYKFMFPSEKRRPRDRDNEEDQAYLDAIGNIHWAQKAPTPPPRWLPAIVIGAMLLIIIGLAVWLGLR